MPRGTQLGEKRLRFAFPVRYLSDCLASADFHQFGKFQRGQRTDGNLYGTAPSGGANSGGTVFKMTPTGTLTTLYSFCAQPKCTDGMTPLAGLVLATNGTFYGTTSSGGVNGDGTVFSITAGGTLTTLHSFDINTDGADIIGALIQGTNGNFYGVAGEGGPPPTNKGTVFSITSGGTVTTLHGFDITDGYDPFAALVQGTNGTFYGTTTSGGANGDYGTVFSITSGGSFTTLHSFDGTDGYYPNAALVQATNGTFYGTTGVGGANGYGTVFSITAGGTLTTLHSFDLTDGAEPFATLVQATNGNFYGTTRTGGTADCSFGQPCGNVFSITAGGTPTTLHSFDGTDGNGPDAALVQATNGTFYGVTYDGGASNYGTIFSLAVGLHPFVETLPTSGHIGAHVKILGTNLTGATSVTFNGMPATFTVASKTEITTTVPTGATTGTVEVTTSSGMLKSNKKFRVTP
jgi:uncharacterized repeat protein (TIGR03803 family)